MKPAADPAVIAPSVAAVPEMDRRYVVAALMLVMTLTSMEQTVTSTAMPTIIGDLHGLEHYSWVASIYLLSMTVLMPLWGRLADTFGRKRIILMAISIFALGSMLSSFAMSMPQLILFRGVQGLGAGGVMPVILTILSDIFTLKQRARVQAFFSVIWGVSAMAGPALGAFLVTTLGWRSIFYINLPLGIIGLLVLIRKYHEHEKPHKTQLDLGGVIALGVGCTSLLALVSRLGPGGWAWPMALGLVATTLLAMATFLVHEQRTQHPIMPPKLITHRMIGPAMAGMFLLGLGVLCVDTYVPLYVQGGRGGGPAAAASVVTPVILSWSISNIFAAPLLVRWGFRKMAIVGSSIIVIGFLGLLACAIFHLGHLVLTITLCLSGLGFGPSSLSFLLSAQEAVDYQQRGSVTSMLSFFRTIGGAIGIGVLGALLQTRIAPTLASLQSQGITPASVLDPHRAADLPRQAMIDVQSAIASAMVWVFGAMLALALLQAFGSTFLSAKKAEHKLNAAEAMEAMG